jgi:hypothetical protein
MLLASKIWADGYDGNWETVDTRPMAGDLDLFYDIRGICTPAAIVALAFCGIRWITASDPKTADTAKKWLLAILGGVALFWIIPAMLPGITGTQ